MVDCSIQVFGPPECESKVSANVCQVKYCPCSGPGCGSTRKFTKAAKRRKRECKVVLVKKEAKLQFISTLWISCRDIKCREQPTFLFLLLSKRRNLILSDCQEIKRLARLFWLAVDRFWRILRDSSDHCRHLKIFFSILFFGGNKISSLQGTRLGNNLTTDELEVRSGFFF